MITKSMHALEFDKIKEMLCNNAVSDEAKARLALIEPSLSESEVTAKISDTTQARKILDTMGSAPLAAMKDIGSLLELAQKGAMLIPEQLNQISLFINACRRIKSYLKRAESLNVSLAGYGDSIDEPNSLSNEIQRAIRNNQVDDNASKDLMDSRRQITSKGCQNNEKRSPGEGGTWRSDTLASRPGK